MSVTSLDAEVWSEPFKSFNDNAAVDFCMQNCATGQHLKENQVANRMKALNGKLTDSAVFSEDGSFHSKGSSITSYSTSGVFSSLSSTIDENKQLESSTIKHCPSPEEYDSTIENNENNAGGSQESAICATEGSEVSVSSSVVIDPCNVEETLESCYEVTIHHTVVNQTETHLSLIENTDLDTSLISGGEDSSGDDLETEQSFFDEERYCLRSGNKDSDYNENFDSLYNEKEVPISETLNVSENVYYSDESEIDFPNAEVHEYFEIQRKSLHGQYLPGLNGVQIAQQEMEKVIEEKIENGLTKRGGIYQDFVSKPREDIRSDYIPICPVVLENDEELATEEKEYVETRKLSSYDKYTNGPFNSRPIPMDDILEERAHFQVPRVCWVCTGFASEDYGDTFTAVVPFANEMREEDREEYPKQELSIKEKIKEKLRKFKQIITRKSRKVELVPAEEDSKSNGEDGQEFFLIQVEGSWNICYEAEATEEETHLKVGAVVSLGKYCPPNSDDVRKSIAKNPSLCTIIEDDEDITGN